MPRFIHTADWQIGRHYPFLEADDAVRLADARLAAVVRLMALAVRLDVDAVLVAGDVFDAQTVSDKTLRRLFAALGTERAVVLLPGNHDAALAESVWTRAQRLDLVPPQVHLALRPEAIVLPSMAVLPAPLVQRHTRGDATAWFDTAETPPGLCRIGLAHGSVQGILAEGMDADNPIAADRAQRARLDYLALGDWHGLRQIDARTAYSGTPEPERFRDNGAGQALLVEVDAPGALPRLRPLATAAHTWQQQAVDLQVPSDVAALIDASTRWPARLVLRLVLSGHIDLASHARLQRALDEARARVASLSVDEQGLQVAASEAELDELAVDGYLLDVLAELRARQAQGDATADEAMRVFARSLMQQRGLA
ncbi:hypothetical protein CCO03_16005 [Comamonas serinivorans]|uniref:Calcineurin-like phosphoesterase domain-containing protein n=1 Tax=Comamonas serinivorans TaxID=1082851 RepID=A0A1Y0ERF2_9BURK|nr:DNA repair exonuclease [Comamonas serinivorans]ARU05971.1 hypothetical protein CCO03_16005 [Comamonas serinivorans]